MFYSHEILTSREHGVATIWLVATLGARSTMKRVNRKAILNVDVPRACNTIINPVSPMALRLQSNLLYGVSRVYREQCVYTLTDVQVLLSKMRATLRAARGMGLDPDAGKARPDQLILPYDPGFVPELSLPGLGIDFSNLVSVTGVKHLSPDCSLLSKTSGNASQISSRDLIVPQLDISSSCLNLGEIDGLHMMSGGLIEAAHPVIDLGNESGILLQPDFEFDEEGNIVDLFRSGIRGSVSRPQTLSPSGHLRAHSLLPGSHLQPTENRGDLLDHDGDDVVLLGNDTEIPPEQSSTPKQNLLPDPDYIDKEVKSPNTERVKGPMKKRTKPFGNDDATKIPQTTFIDWNNNYLKFMRAAKRRKIFNQKITWAKKYAYFWAFETGIGSVGAGMGASSSPHPLKEFSGESLMRLLTGKSYFLSSKRGLYHDNGNDDNDSEPILKRARVGDAAIDLPRGRVEGEVDGTTKDDVEIGRHAPPSLHDDMSSQMPWNITASLQGSRLGSASSFPRPFDSEEFSSQHQLNAMGQPYGRLASVSPLAGRSRFGDPSNHERLSSLSIARGGLFDDESPVTNFNLGGGAHHGQDYDPMFADYQQVPEHYTPKIQNILPSLNAEEINFFTFMEAHLVAIRPSAAIAFSNLLSPNTTSKVVATQGLIHLLTFATNGVVKIEQNAELLHHKDGDDETVDFSEIFISINL